MPAYIILLCLLVSLITVFIEAQRVSVVQPKNEIRIQEWGGFSITPQISISEITYSDLLINIKQASGASLVTDMSYTKGVFSFNTRKGYAGRYDLTMSITLTDSKALVYQTFYNFSVVVEPLPLAKNTTIILQDDFSDGNINVVDNKLVNGMSWKVLRGTVGNDMKIYTNNSLVVSNDTVDFNDVTLYFETYSTLYTTRGVTFMYIDENNYYEINLSTPPLRIVRVMNGVRTVLLEGTRSELLPPLYGNYYGSFKIYILKANNITTIKYGKLGYSGDYCLTVADTNPGAFNKFNSKSRFGFYERTTNSPTISRYSILNVKVTKGIRTDIRAPITYFVDPIHGSDNNTGLTLPTAWKTLRRSQMMLLPGDTLFLANGVYREPLFINASTVVEQAITIKAVEQGKAVIHGAELLKSSSWTVFTNSPLTIYKYNLQRSVFSHFVLQDSVPLVMVMKPTPPKNDLNLVDNYVTVGAKDVFVGRYLSPADGVLEYLNLHSMFRNNSNGDRVTDNYWVNATIYHYSPISDSIITKKIVAYNATLNQATLILLKYQPTISANDRYAMALHPGLISKPGEYVFTEGFLYISPYNGTDPKYLSVETSLLQDGVVIDQMREGFILDGFTVQRFLGNGIYCVNGCSDMKITNVKSLFNRNNGLYIGNTNRLYVGYSEFAYNNQNGISLNQKKTNFIIENCNCHHNSLKGISIGYSNIQTFYCWNGVVRNNIFRSYLSDLALNSNLLIYGCTNVTISENYFQNNYAYNLIIERIGEINITKNIFINGSLLIINNAKSKVYNNDFINSGLRFKLNFETSVRYSSFVGASSFAYGAFMVLANDVKAKSNYVANTLLWDKNTTLVDLLSSINTNNSTLVQDQTIRFINSVISDLSFPSKHLEFINNFLLENGTVKLYWDALVKRGLLDKKGNLLGVNTSVEKEVEEIRGFTRSILDELVLDGKVYKAETNFYPRSFIAANNVFINCEYIAPNSSYSLLPYWNFTNNYFNLQGVYYKAWQTIPMDKLTNIWKTDALDLKYNFVNPYLNNYNLLNNSTLIDAGVDVGLGYDGLAPDIGAFERDYIGVKTFKSSSKSDTEAPPQTTSLKPIITSSTIPFGYETSLRKEVSTPNKNSNLESLLTSSLTKFTTSPGYLESSLGVSRIPSCNVKGGASPTNMNTETSFNTLNSPKPTSNNPKINLPSVEASTASKNISPIEPPGPVSSSFQPNSIPASSPVENDAVIISQSQQTPSIQLSSGVPLGKELVSSSEKHESLETLAERAIFSSNSQPRLESSNPNLLRTSTSVEPKQETSSDPFASHLKSALSPKESNPIDSNLFESTSSAKTPEITTPHSDAVFTAPRQSYSKSLSTPVHSFISTHESTPILPSSSSVTSSNIAGISPNKEDNTLSSLKESTTVLYGSTQVSENDEETMLSTSHIEEGSFTQSQQTMNIASSQTLVSLLENASSSPIENESNSFSESTVASPVGPSLVAVGSSIPVDSSETKLSPSQKEESSNKDIIDQNQSDSILNLHKFSSPINSNEVSETMEQSTNKVLSKPSNLLSSPEYKYLQPPEKEASQNYNGEKDSPTISGNNALSTAPKISHLTEPRLSISSTPASSTQNEENSSIPQQISPLFSLKGEFISHSFKAIPTTAKTFVASSNHLHSDSLKSLDSVNTLYTKSTSTTNGVNIDPQASAEKQSTLQSLQYRSFGEKSSKDSPVTGLSQPNPSLSGQELNPKHGNLFNSDSEANYISPSIRNSQFATSYSSDSTGNIDKSLSVPTSSTPKSCSFNCNHGICSEDGKCDCNQYYFGEYCNMTTCNGILSTEAKVCSGRGACFEYNNCICQNGYLSNDCSIITCFGIPSNYSNVCGSNGLCVKPDICLCNEGFTGSTCQTPKCFGVSSFNPLVCSSRGACIEKDKCKCNENYFGYQCQYYRQKSHSCIGLFSNVLEYSNSGTNIDLHFNLVDLSCGQVLLNSTFRVSANEVNLGKLTNSEQKLFSLVESGNHITIRTFDREYGNINADEVIYNDSGIDKLIYYYKNDVFYGITLSNSNLILSTIDLNNDKMVKVIGRISDILVANVEDINMAYNSKKELILFIKVITSQGVLQLLRYNVCQITYSFILLGIGEFSINDKIFIEKDTISSKEYIVLIRNNGLSIYESYISYFSNIENDDTGGIPPALKLIIQENNFKLNITNDKISFVLFNSTMQIVNENTQVLSLINLNTKLIENIKISMENSYIKVFGLVAPTITSISQRFSPFEGGSLIGLKGVLMSFTNTIQLKTTDGIVMSTLSISNNCNLQDYNYCFTTENVMDRLIGNPASLNVMLYLEKSPTYLTLTLYNNIINSITPDKASNGDLLKITGTFFNSTQLQCRYTIPSAKRKRNLNDAPVAVVLTKGTYDNENTIHCQVNGIDDLNNGKLVLVEVSNDGILFTPLDYQNYFVYAAPSYVSNNKTTGIDNFFRSSIDNTTSITQPIVVDVISNTTYKEALKITSNFECEGGSQETKRKLLESPTKINIYKKYIYLEFSLEPSSNLYVGNTAELYIFYDINNYFAGKVGFNEENNKVISLEWNLLQKSSSFSTICDFSTFTIYTIRISVEYEDSVTFYLIVELLNTNVERICYVRNKLLLSNTEYLDIMSRNYTISIGQSLSCKDYTTAYSGSTSLIIEDIGVNCINENDCASVILENQTPIITKEESGLDVLKVVIIVLVVLFVLLFVCVLILLPCCIFILHKRRNKKKKNANIVSPRKRGKSYLTKGNSSQRILYVVKNNDKTVLEFTSEDINEEEPGSVTETVVTDITKSNNNNTPHSLNTKSGASSMYYTPNQHFKQETYSHSEGGTITSDILTPIEETDIDAENIDVFVEHVDV
ncbi:hypothetical protein ABK040_015116 [Willaertia magna]